MKALEVLHQPYLGEISSSWNIINERSTRTTTCVCRKVNHKGLGDNIVLAKYRDTRFYRLLHVE